MIRFATLLTVFIILQGCTQSIGHHKQASFSASSLEAGKLLYIEPDVSVKELGIANAEEVPQWSEEGKSNLEAQIQAFLNLNTGLILVKSSNIPAEKIPMLEEYVALYGLVAAQHLSIQSHYDLGWKAVKPVNNFSLGEGLSFLKDESGLDIALLTVAEDYISSGGRVATQIGLALLGVGVPGGQCVVHSGIVDLETGNIQWTNTTASTTHSLRSAENTADMVKELFKELPTN